MSWMVRCALGVWLVACSADEEPHQTTQTDVERDAGGDITEDLSPLPGPTAVQGLGLAVSGGVAESPSFRFQYTLAAPVVTGPASSDGFVTGPSPAGPASAGGGE